MSFLQKSFIYLEFLQEATLNAILLRNGGRIKKVPFFSSSTLDFCKSLGYFNISPDKLNEKHIYIYQSYLVNEKKIGYSSFRIMVNALRFFYNKVMHYDWLIKYIPYQKKRLNYQPY
jgi:hypothetical protein